MQSLRNSQQQNYIKLSKSYLKASKRRTDLTEAYFLCRCYFHYHLMEANRMCADLSVEEAEKIQFLHKVLMGEEIGLSDILSSSDERINDCLNNWERYRKMREIFAEAGYDGGDVDAFCKMVFNNPVQHDMTMYRIYAPTLYFHLMESVMMYIYGEIDEEKLSGCMVKIDVLKRERHPLSPKEVRFFVRQMIHALGVFREISSKRKRRKLQGKV